MIVGKIFYISVVIHVKITFLGGSSNVFNNALKALVESIWTSSIIKILYLPFNGKKSAFSIMERIFSTPLLLATSISKISGWLLLLENMQLGHLSHIKFSSSLFS